MFYAQLYRVTKIKGGLVHSPDTDVPQGVTITSSSASPSAIDFNFNKRDHKHYNACMLHISLV